ncbi:subtilisin-like protease [Dendrothele bispora CBS 962.96]|uniref:Subtilisin-like protease n=1 Tax=Dendrothele bispora (strain CBS 962.96) TaxID=1314807 RepID=A0A4S8LWX7_DENBC|nr:subtilisin-like protease [Dendrothele bispora CBS 962.96]
MASSSSTASRRSTFLVLFVFFSLCVSTASSTNLTGNRFIVEMDQSTIPQTSGARRSVGFDVHKEFNMDGVFVGASLTLENAKDIHALSNAQGVKAVRPALKVTRPNPITRPISGNFSLGVESTHVMTGVDKLHDQGLTGKGIKIGIIDTGVDYTHPALGGGFGPGFKIAGGYDFVGDAYDGEYKLFAPPSGTHVTGIVGADPSNPYNISGVAYNSTLSMYRIFGCAGDTTDDIIVEALLRGVDDGQDILSLSIGDSTDGWTEGTASVVVSRISSMGITVTVAAGNDGPSGAWYSSSPGNAVDAISVASVDNTMIFIHNATVQGAEHDPIPYYSLASFFFEGPMPIYATSNDTTVQDDACNALPDDTPDLSPYVVIVRRGTCDFPVKQANIMEKGAQAVLFYDNGTDFDFIDIGNNSASIIRAEDGEFLVKEFVAGTPIDLVFPQEPDGVTPWPTATGGLVSTFSSYGPSNDFFFKPSIAAPGGNIMSTFPVNMGSYIVASGTSMATPYLAGSLALLMQLKGHSIVGMDARTLFEATSKVIPTSKDDGAPLHTVTQQGAGLINVYDALYVTTSISPGELILNDTAHFREAHPITIQNNGDSARDYTVSHSPAATALTIDPDTGLPAPGPVPQSTAYANVSFSQTSFTLSPGEVHTITAQFTPPAGADPLSYPVYSGFIQISTGTEQLHVSYMGLAAALLDKQTLDNSSVVLTSNSQNSGQDVQARAVTDAHNYTFIGDDYPSMQFRQGLMFGTPLVRIDLVNSNFSLSTLPPTVSRRQDSGSAAAVPILGPVYQFTYLARNDNLTNPFYFVNFTAPLFSDGTQIPNGMYRYLMRTLRVTGNPNNEEDYDEYLSPAVGFNAPANATAA